MAAMRVSSYLYHTLTLFLFFACTVASPMSSCTDTRSTYYDYDGVGHCSFETLGGPLLPMLNVAAPNTHFYNNASHCGECWELSGPSGSVTVMIVDECPAVPDNYPWCYGDMDHFDLGATSTFADIANPDVGSVLLTKRQVTCPFTNTMGVKIEVGSTPYSLGLLVYAHKVGITKVEIQPNGASWYNMPRAVYNYWHYSGTVISNSFNVRITGQTGEVITMNIPSLTSGATYDSGKQFSNPIAGFGASTNAECAVPTGDPYIYTDALYEGCCTSTEWQDWSFGTTVDYSCPNAAVGAYSMCTTIPSSEGIQLGKVMDQTWNGVYQYLSFYVRADQPTSGMQVSFGGINPYTFPVTTTWTKIKLDLQNTMKAPLGVGATNPLLFVNSLGSTTPKIYIDQIQFEYPDGVSTGSPTQVPPTQAPTPRPTQAPTPRPTQPPTPAPTPRPTQAPTPAPTPRPTQAPTPRPTQPPTPAPTPRPTQPPTPAPTPRPTQPPTLRPTQPPTPAPTPRPTQPPTPAPTPRPTQPPTPAPTPRPTQKPTPAPTPHPTQAPTPAPTPRPTQPPTPAPTPRPTQPPTPRPTQPPTARPTTGRPTPAPTPSPMQRPTQRPTEPPTHHSTTRQSGSGGSGSNSGSHSGSHSSSGSGNQLNDAPPTDPPATPTPTQVAATTSENNGPTSPPPTPSPSSPPPAQPPSSSSPSNSSEIAPPASPTAPPTHPPTVDFELVQNCGTILSPVLALVLPLMYILCRL